MLQRVASPATYDGNQDTECEVPLPPFHPLDMVVHQVAYPPPMETESIPTLPSMYESAVE